MINVNLAKFMSIVALATISSLALATNSTISEHNLILIGDYNFQGGDVQGSVVVGGNLNASGTTFEAASRLTNLDSSIDAVTIVGNVNANEVRVLNSHNLVYGGNLNASFDSQGQRSQALKDTSLTTSAIANELYADSAYYASLATNGSFLGGQLTYSGVSDIAVFDISASDLFAQNTTLKLVKGLAETVIINVSGTNILVDGGVNLTDGFTQESVWDNILWNFYDGDVNTSTSIDFGNLAMKGSVLAPYANTTGGSSFDGAFAALSYTGAREFHNYLFDYDGNPKGPNTGTAEVSEPSLLLLLVSAFGLLLMRSRSKRQ